MKVGKYKISIIETGTFGLDGGAMFGIIPKPLWERNVKADANNRITLGARCLLLESESKKILIETGLGNIWDEKFNKIYKVDNSHYSLISSLNNVGVKANDITDVILTHLHFDHTGGSTIMENDKYVPTFPNAKYHVQKEHFKWALNPSIKDRGSFISHTFMPLYEEGLLNFISGDSFFDDEIKLIPINGHTIAQQMLKIFDSSKTYLFCADLIPTAYHIPLPYIMGYDIQPLETVKEKQKYLKLAVDEDWQLIFGHDSINTAASVKITEKGFSYNQLIKEI